MRIFLICLLLGFCQLTQAQYNYFYPEKGTVEMNDGTLKEGYFSFKKGIVKYCVKYKRKCEDIPMNLVKKVSQKLDLPKGSNENDLESRGIKTRLNYVPLISEEGSILFAALMFEGKKHNLYMVYSDSPRKGRKEWVYITKKDSDVVIESYHNDLGNIKKRQLKVLEKYFDLCPEFVNDKNKRIGYSNLECSN